MKKRILFLLTLPLGILTLSSYHNGIAINGLGNRTGSAGGPANCSGSGCHTGNTSVTMPQLSLLAGGGGTVSTKYIPGATYRLAIGGVSTAPTPPAGFGFQLSAVAANGTQAGVFQGGGGLMRVSNAGNLTVLEHIVMLQAGAASFGNNTNGSWIAPSAGTGPVKFYLTLNAVNNNSTTSGDAPNNIVVTIDEDVSTAVAEIPEIKGLSLSPNPATETLRLRLEQPAEKAYELCIFDMSGKMQICQKLTGSQLQNTTDISIAALPAGFYVAHISGGDAVKSLPFLKK